MATVSRALNGLVRQQTQTIGIIVPDITSPFYSQLMELAAGGKYHSLCLC